MTDAPPPSRTPPRAPDWSAVRRVHLMGVCGSAMGALALMLRDRGLEVRGSDAAPYPPMSDRLAAAGVSVARGYRAENLDWGPDAAVIGNVMRPDSPEVLALRALDLPAASMSETLRAIFLRDATPIVVTGTHGKTTTASMTAWILHEAGLDPSFFIGGVVAPWDRNYRLGSEAAQAPFVVEGDEYDTAFWDKDSKFHHYAPRFASLNNLEFDHADIFPDLAAIIDTFRRFAARVPPDGRIVTPWCDANTRAALVSAVAPVWFTAIAGVDAGASEADIRAEDLSTSPDATAFTLHLPGSIPAAVRLAVPGLHNVRNALAAAGLALAAGVSTSDIAAALGTFRLPLRRLTPHGSPADVPLIDDFAHHPTAIAATIAAVRLMHPGRRVVALFEVQSNTARRRVFQQAFGDALATADRVWFCQPLAKASDPLPPEARLDLPALAADIATRGVPADIITSTEALADAVARDAVPGADVIVAMSGRDLSGLLAAIKAALEARLT
jgi:UDP-N-acetylmuramate: L-alanyl-gamma-D-glutamyl-meso-diaminopimelate ligase